MLIQIALIALSIITGFRILYFLNKILPYRSGIKHDLSYVVLPVVELLVWIDVRKVSEAHVRSELYFTIFGAFQDSGISIPFPQRDLHIRSGPSWPDKQE